LFELGRDLAQLRQMIDRLENCRLVVIDPISAYLGRAVENANAEVRCPLAQLAAERRLAVVLVTHLRKEDGAAMYRAIGSLAFVAAARGAWVICQDPHDTRRGLFLPLKNNLASGVGGLAYTIECHSPRGDGAAGGRSLKAGPAGQPNEPHPWRCCCTRSSCCGSRAKVIAVGNRSIARGTLPRFIPRSPT
jgi:hypothetical protein